MLHVACFKLVLDFEGYMPHIESLSLFHVLIEVIA